MPVLLFSRCRATFLNYSCFKWFFGISLTENDFIFSEMHLKQKNVLVTESCWKMFVYFYLFINSGVNFVLVLRTMQNGISKGNHTNYVHLKLSPWNAYYYKLVIFLYWHNFSFDCKDKLFISLKRKVDVIRISNDIISLYVFFLFVFFFGGEFI